MDKKIEKFLEKWNEMLIAANEIEEFKYKISVSITSDNTYVEQRNEMINGINAGFINTNMTYETTIRV